MEHPPPPSERPAAGSEHRPEPPPAAPVLGVAGAEKRFQETPALVGVDLELHAGELLALLGPNGAGKTTLIRAIAGLVRLDRGRIHLDGAPLEARRDAARAAIGLVPQEIALYPLLTAAENLAAWGRLTGQQGSALEQRIEWALDWTGLASRQHDRVDTFSGGMKRRLNIACAVLHDPRLVLLDEPTVGVDPQSRQRIWQMLRSLRKGGTALLLTTHQLDEAQSVSDRIVIIDHGRVIANGTFDQLVETTVGSPRRVELRFRRPPAGRLPAGLEPLDPHRATTRLDDVAGRLPRLLAELAASGLEVIDLAITAPSLEAVFIHLTGRELRE